MIKTPGIDLSVANDSLLTISDDVDFEAVYASGRRFAYFKATEGEMYRDPQFVRYVERASATPLHLGAYAFARVDDDPTDDVENFLRATDKVQKQLILAPWYDLETRENKSAQQILDHTMGWADGHIRRRGCGIILYSYLGYIQSLIRELGGPASAGASDLVQFPLALAQYTSGEPTCPLPWKRWTFHQWAASAPGGPIGACPGVNGMVDLVWYNGSESDMEWLFTQIEAK
jgi:lysozyme